MLHLVGSFPVHDSFLRVRESISTLIFGAVIVQVAKMHSLVTYLLWHELCLRLRRVDWKSCHCIVNVRYSSHICGRHIAGTIKVLQIFKNPCCVYIVRATRPLLATYYLFTLVYQCLLHTDEFIAGHILFAIKDWSWFVREASKFEHFRCMSCHPIARKTILIFT